MTRRETPEYENEIRFHPLDHRLMDVAVLGRLGRLQEDEQWVWVDCRHCDNEHLGELYESPPDGFRVRHYCLKEEKRDSKPYI